MAQSDLGWAMAAIKQSAPAVKGILAAHLIAFQPMPVDEQPTTKGKVVGKVK